MKNKLILLTFAIIAFSCSKEQAVSPSLPSDDNLITDKFTINAPSTKTSLSGSSVSWNNGDKIYYFSGHGTEYETKKNVTVNSNDKSADIELQRNESDNFYVLVHDGIENPLIKKSGITDFAFSGINPAQDGTFASANICASYKEVDGTGGISFYNITTPLEFNIGRTDITKVTFTGNNSEYVNGRLQVNFEASSGSFPYTVSRYSNYPNATNEAPDSILFASTPSTSAPYYFNVMPQTFKKGFTITYIGNDGTSNYTIGTTKTSSSIDFAPGVMKYISGINVEYTTRGFANYNNWVYVDNKSFYQTCNLDENITIDAGEQTEQGYFFISSGNYYWRLYENRGGSFTLKADDGYIIKKVTFNYDSKAYGVIKDGSTIVTSGTSVTVNAQSKEFTLSHSEGSEKGRVAFKSIKVSYQKNN